MANIQLLQGTEKIKDSYGKINISLQNLNNDKLEKNGADKLNFSTSGPVLTISNGAITVTQSYHIVDTEGGAPADDLEIINGGNPGDILFLRQNDFSRVITIKNSVGVGNVRTWDATDIVMNNANSIVMLFRTGTNWLAVGTNGVKRAGDHMTGFLTFANYRGLLSDGDDTGANLEHDFPNLTTGSANLRAFRNTNTTGNKNFILYAGDGSANPAFWVQNGRIIWISGQNVMITAHAGNPNGNVTAPPGSICLNTSGGAGASIYVKESGTGNTGWVAK